MTVLRITLVMAVILGATTIMHAQPGGLGGSGTGGPPPGAGAPIDGGASMFLAGVALYAHRKHKAKKQSQTDEQK